MILTPTLASILHKLHSKPKLIHNRFSFSLFFAVMASNAWKVLAPIADGTNPMEAFISIGVLWRSGAFDLTVASAVKHLSVQALYGIKILADASISDFSNTAFDLIAIPVSLELINGFDL